MKVNRILLFVLLILNSNRLFSQTSTIQSIDSIVHLFLKNKCFNGDILVTVDCKTFYQKNAGYRDNVAKDTIQRNQIFNIGSISKPFTSIAILQLQQRDLLDINANVLKYLPEFPYDNICVKHLLSHTSGLRQNFGQIEELDVDAFINNDSVIPILSKYKPQLFATPGAEWIYSNIGYEVLSLIVERVSKMEFSDYMRKHVFEPAKMHRTFIPTHPKITQLLPRGIYEKDLFVPHEFKTIADCDVSLVDSVNFVQQRNSFLVGSENVYSCLEDLSKFDLVLRKNKILSKELQQLAYTPFVLENGNKATDLNAPIPSYFGLGWFISIDTIQPQIIWHKGRSHGSRSIFLRVPEKKQIVAMTDNFDNSAVDLKGISLLRILNGQPYRNPVLMSLVQKLGCETTSSDVKTALVNFEHRKNTERKNYYISEEEIIQLSELLISRQKISDAKSILFYSKSLFQKSSNIYSEYAKIMLLEHQYDSAKVNFSKAVELSGERDIFLNSLGYNFFNFNNYTSAEFVLKLNTELYPSTGNVFDSYALILDKNGKLNEAIIAQEKAVKIATETSDKLLETFKDNLNILIQKKEKWQQIEK